MKKLLLILAMFTSSVFAQDTYKIVVPFAPGGGTDLTARKLAQYIAKDLNATVIVENKPGANTSIATNEVIKAPADGKTMLLSSPSALEGNTTDVNLPSYNWQKELRPLAITTPVSPWVLVSSKKYKTMDDLTQALKTRPVNFGSTNAAGSHVILAKMLVKELNLGITDTEVVVYKSSAALVNEIVTGALDATFSTAYFAAPLINDGKINALAVESAKRLSYLPDVPTFAELGLKNVHVGNDYYGLWVPAQTPEAVFNNLQKIVYKYVKNGGELHTEFASTNFINTQYTIPLDPAAEQAKFVKILKSKQQEFLKN